MNLNKDRRPERGATLVEYALGFALILIVSIAALDSLSVRSGSYVSQTADDVGKPPTRISDLDPDLPDPPKWLTDGSIPPTTAPALPAATKVAADPVATLAPAVTVAPGETVAPELTVAPAP